VYPNPDPIAGAGPGVNAVEYRGAPRYRVLQRCIVRPPDVAEADGWRGIVFSMSQNGAGVTLPMPVARGTEVQIEPWNLPGAPPLKARVVHLTRLEAVWLAGCELNFRLTDDELSAWLTNATAGP
jgi:hypothetical protein